MRTALLSALEVTQGGQTRAFERLGGRFLLDWQIDAARELGCAKVICLAERESEQMIAVRARAEQAGIEFRLVRGPLPLVGMLSADQELVVMADGLLTDRETLHDLFGNARGVLALPHNEGIQAGFERIDAEYAWGGVMVIRAQIAAQLADMPPDSDTVSLLLRLALQSGTRIIPAGADLIENGDWLLVRDRAALIQREKMLLDRSVEQASWLAPSKAIGRLVARAFAPDRLEQSPAIALGLGWVGISIALGAASWGYNFAALVILATGILAFACGEGLARLKSRLRGTSRPLNKGWIGMATDISFVGAIALPTSVEAAPSAVFLPLMAVGLLRLSESHASSRWKATWADRALFIMAVLPAAWFDVIDQVLGAACMAMLAFCLFSRQKSQITQA